MKKRNHLSHGGVMRVEIVFENVRARIMVLGCMQLENIPMHA
jgi:hypothetical protein